MVIAFAHNSWRHHEERTIDWNSFKQHLIPLLKGTLVIECFWIVEYDESEEFQFFKVFQMVVESFPAKLLHQGIERASFV